MQNQPDVQEFFPENPITKLWRQFNFRQNYTSSRQQELQTGGHVSSEGFHFVQLQDFQLFEDCKQYVKILFVQSVCIDN